MIRMLDKYEWPRVKSFLEEESEYNTYILGDVYCYGLDSSDVELYYADNLCIMRYGNSYVVYGDVNRYRDDLSQFFQNRPFHCISGKKSTVVELSKMMKFHEIIHNDMLVLKSISDVKFLGSDYEIIHLGIDDMKEMQDLYCTTEEFKEKFIGINGERRIQNQYHNGAIFGLKKDGSLLSIAMTSAESEKLVMVDCVATRPEYRGRGYAKALLSFICRECLFDKCKEKICICCSNDVAKKVYMDLGFTEIGCYSMAYSDGE